MKTVTRSFSILLEDSEWLDKQAKETGRSKSQVVASAIGAARTLASGTFIQDVRWVLAHKLGNMEVIENPAGDNFDLHLEIVNKSFENVIVLGATNTLDRLHELFARCILHRDRRNRPVIFLIPYKLDPEHQVWKSIRDMDNIRVCTPDNLPRIIKDLLRQGDDEVVPAPQADD